VVELGQIDTVQVGVFLAAFEGMQPAKIDRLGLRHMGQFPHYGLW